MDGRILLGEEIGGLKYDLERLGPHGFQDVAAAIAINRFGPQVHRLGAGRDGGRDMECKGVIVWAATDDQPGEMWDGHTVFQVKHRSRLENPPKDLAWLWKQVKKELDLWADPDSGRASVPNYLVFVTNVPLTPVPESGGLATLYRNIEDYLAGVDDDTYDDGSNPSTTRERKVRASRLGRLKSWRIWDGNQIDGLLDADEGVRRAFDGFLTAGDVLADITRLSDNLPADELGPALQAHARSSLIRERNLYFDEAGGDGPGIAVDKIAVDLPIRLRDTGEQGRVLRYVIDRGDRALKPSKSTLDKPRHLVITGPPGNGKTTVSRFLVQCYRAAMLAEADALGDDHRDAITSTAARLKLLKRGLPHHRRWAVRVDLAKYAKQYVSMEHKTLLSWIAHNVSSESNTRTLKPWVLKEWMAAWPWFVVLDGLDEVSEPAVRQWLIGTIHGFVADAEGDDCDVLVVVTTRPTGYAEEMPTEQFEHVDLDSLTIPEALAYGHLVTEVRLRNDSARIERVDMLLRDAAENEALVHLLRTPLQVQIMTIIAESAGQFAPDRYSLFWRYYETVVRREQSKEGTLSALLREHAPQILDLHERVGLELQKRSETAADATASLPEKDLEGLAWQVLTDEGYKPSGKDADLLRRIVITATHRLVLIAPRDDGYGFDVRSLQELMAARRLTTGTLDTVLERLKTIAASPHWRNTWVFAAGRYFAEPQAHQHEGITRLVCTLDDGVIGRLASIFPVGPYLAWDLIDDGMAAARPRWLHRLIDHGLTALTYPAPQDVVAFADALYRTAVLSEDLRGRIRDALRDALSGDPSTRKNAALLQLRIGRGTDHDETLLSIIKCDPSRSPAPAPPDGWAHFEDAIATYPDEDIEDLVRDAADAIRDIARNGATPGRCAQVMRSLVDADAAEVLEIALDSIARHEPRLVSGIADGVLPTMIRRPVADQLEVHE